MVLCASLHNAVEVCYTFTVFVNGPNEATIGVLAMVMVLMVVVLLFKVKTNRDRIRVGFEVVFDLK